jgi:hypothetical protein
MKRQTIGLGTKTTAWHHMAVAGWGKETVAFTATTPVVDGVDQPMFISEMNGTECYVPFADAPLVIKQHLSRWGR